VNAPAPATPARDTDVLVVGGGVNGVGVARDLAGRGLQVLLVERDDFGSHTSGASTKLIHGGLRYLEYYEFLMVRKSLAEREVLLRAAPHIMWPLRFVMPHDPSMRPAWMIRMGLFLYDHLARREWLPGSAGVSLAQHPAGSALKPHMRYGFVYSDGWVDDSRLVVLNAVDAAARGARIHTRCACIAARREGGRWLATMRESDGRQWEVSARALVNVGGPWAAEFVREVAGRQDARSLRIVKGSHIVVPRLFEHENAYIFQNEDKRIIFAIPYEDDFTLVGTTDIDQGHSTAAPTCGPDEIAYLCTQANRYLKRQISPADVVWTYSGVRPLLDADVGNPAAVTRDYLLELERDGAPLLNVWGGKLTTFRKLGEEVADRVCQALEVKASAWTSGVPLPGGDLSGWIEPTGRPDIDIRRFAEALEKRHPGLDPSMRRRWVRSYGSRVELILGERGDLGPRVAPGLHDAELRYLCEHEWARSADDVLWRRSKLGLHLDAAQRDAVAAWFAQRPGVGTPS
jgi:glycerol-3-phosphate dehydrogenase